MWNQFEAIAWAQFRSIRNRLPRTSFGSVLMGILVMLWYGIFTALGAGAGYVVSVLGAAQLQRVLSPALLGAFLFWQWMPLLTMSGGWSLQLNKLRTYPISTGTFFWMETALRLSTAPELLLVVFGAAAGLLWNPAVPKWSAFLLLLYVPFNLFLTLAIRETLLTSFHRSRFRELFAVFVVAIAILPQILLRTPVGERVKPFWAILVQTRWTPWHSFAALSAGHLRAESFAFAFGWTGAAWWLARRQFAKALRTEETLRPDVEGSHAVQQKTGLGFAGWLASAVAGLFRDPIAVVVEKEIRSLVRMPRFRVIFGMACVFSILVFFPIGFGKGSAGWVRNNFLAVVNLYGLLLLGDTLLWNVFGFDRGAAQIWFVMGLDLRAVIQAKNLTAALFIGLQNATVLIVAALLRFPITWFNVECAMLGSAVVSLYFFAIGNLSSVTVPRAVDPSQTLRKQAGAQLQLWLLGSAGAMMLLVGFAFLARWALASDWALVGVFAVEFAIGLLVYRFALDSAVERAVRNREQILDALTKSTAPVSL
jgi:ABC-2 type transport system permease protein